jgi:hypothetical protein
MTPREQEEYRALRATIRERGTARVWLLTIGIVAWAAIALVVVALALPPVATLLPLVALAATFEGVFALHLGVERIGRYLLVVHGDEWERTAGAFGRPKGAIALDALGAYLFVIAAFINLTPLLLTIPVVQELVVVGVAHVAFVARVLIARAAAARQREVDTARFTQLKNESRQPER